MRTSGSPSELESRRFLAVPRVLEGYSPEEVAAFRQQGVPGLAARPASGRPAKLTTTQEKVVRRWLTESPLDHGFATELWTAANLAHLIEQAWGITLPPRYLGTWLRERGFTPQLPCRVARARDAAAMAAWLAHDWPRIKKRPVGGARTCGCWTRADSSWPRWCDAAGRCRDNRPPLPQKMGHREKISVAAALWLTPRRDRLGLAYQTLVNGDFNNEALADFLEAGLQGLDGPLVAIWDRGRMPKGEPLNELVAQSAGRLDLEPLPAHAPELMPVEQIWTWLKYDRLYNFAPENAQYLEEVVVRELKAIRDDQERLRQFFHASDLPLPRTLLF